jgi:hypothetical protein
MTYAIIRGKNGRRHEVDFADSAVQVEVYASEETIEIFVEADFETPPEEHRRFAIINLRGTNLAKPPEVQLGAQRLRGSETIELALSATKPLQGNTIEARASL